jgi:acyl-CoA dehydrogenase
MDIHGVSERARALASTVREFIEREVVPLERPSPAHDVAALDDLSARLRPLARQAGVWGPRLPVEHGGLDLNWRDAQVVLEEAGRSPLGPLALHCAPPEGPNISTIAALASPAQRERWLLPLIEGTIRSCFAMTEPPPGAGSDPGMLRTRAHRSGHDWVIDGHKWFISGAERAAVAIVMAATDDGPTFFLVDTSTPGWQHVRTIESLDGYQVGGHGEIRLESCRVPGDAVLGEVGRGFEYAQLRLEPARLAHCMRLLGRAARAIEIAQAYVVQRESFGRRLSEHQMVQSLVADSHIDLSAARLMTWQVAARLDAGLSVKHESAMTKVFVSEAIGRVVDRAIQLTGAHGISHDTPLAAFYQELRPFRIYDGASEVHRAAIAQRVLRRQRISMPQATR